jgi:hypothetical protein
VKGMRGGRRLLGAVQVSSPQPAGTDGVTEPPEAAMHLVLRQD